MLIVICLDCKVVTHQGKAGRFIRAFLKDHKFCVEKGSVITIEGKFIPTPKE